MTISQEDYEAVAALLKKTEEAAGQLNRDDLYQSGYLNALGALRGDLGYYFAQNDTRFDHQKGNLASSAEGRAYTTADELSGHHF